MIHHDEGVVCHDGGVVHRYKGGVRHNEGVVRRDKADKLQLNMPWVRHNEARKQSEYVTDSLRRISLRREDVCAAYQHTQPPSS